MQPHLVLLLDNCQDPNSKQISKWEHLKRRTFNFCYNVIFELSSVTTWYLNYLTEKSVLTRTPCKELHFILHFILYYIFHRIWSSKCHDLLKRLKSSFSFSILRALLHWLQQRVVTVVTAVTALYQRFDDCRRLDPTRIYIYEFDCSALKP